MVCLLLNVLIFYKLVYGVCVKSILCNNSSNKIYDFY